MKLRLFLTISTFLVANTLFAQNEDDKKNYRSKILTVNGVEVEVAVMLLDSGKISLFKAIDYYVEISNNSQPIIIKLIKEDKQYITQLKGWMADCPHVTKLIPRTKFKTDALTNLVRLYNSCSPLVETQKAFYNPVFNGSLGAGVSFTTGSIKSSEGYTKKLDWSFKPAATLYVSAALMPPRNKNISIGIDASFSKRTIEGYSKEKTDIETSETFLTIDNPQFAIGLRFVQYRKTYKRIQSFYSAAVGGVFTSNAETKLWNIDSYDPDDSYVSAIKNPSNVKTKSSAYFSFSIGARKLIETNFSLGFELRFDLQPNQVQGDGISNSMLFFITPTIKLGIR